MASKKKSSKKLKKVPLKSVKSLTSFEKWAPLQKI
jgi:hypothetical protein